MAQDVAEVSAKQGAEVVLTSLFPIEQMQANKHEIEQAQAEDIPIRGGLVPVAVIKGPDGRATALRVAQCEAKFVGGKLEIKTIEGTEEDIPADLIVSAIGQAVDFTGLEVFDNGRGAVTADRSYQVQGQSGMFAGGDVHPPAPAHHRDRPRRDRRRRHRPLPGRRGARQAPEDRRARVRPDAQVRRARTGPSTEVDEPTARHRPGDRRDPQLRQPLRSLRDPARGPVPRALRLRAARSSASSSR